MGAVHVPVNFALKGEELRHILRDADVALIAADPALLGLAEEAAVLASVVRFVTDPVRSRSVRSERTRSKRLVKNSREGPFSDSSEVATMVE